MHIECEAPSSVVPVAALDIYVKRPAGATFTTTGEGSAIVLVGETGWVRVFSLFWASLLTMTQFVSMTSRQGMISNTSTRRWLATNTTMPLWCGCLIDMAL